MVLVYYGQVKADTDESALRPKERLSEYLDNLGRGVTFSRRPKRGGKTGGVFGALGNAAGWVRPF